MAFYGLFRVGELAKGDHPVKARDVFLATNKRKMLFILRTSKTHGKGSRPQKIKITAAGKIGKTINHCFCQFKLAADYLAVRGDYTSEVEQFFVFSDKSPVMAGMVRTVFKKLLKRIGQREDHFNLHSLRIGRACQLLKLGYTIEQIKLIGRWKSKAVFRYIRDLSNN